MNNNNIKTSKRRVPIWVPPALNRRVQVFAKVYSFKAAALVIEAALDALEREEKAALSREQ